MPKPTGPQLERLHHLLCDSYDEDSLARLVRINLETHLHTTFSAPGSPFETQVFNLLTVLEQRGTTVKLLQAVLKDQPDRADIQAEFPPIIQHLQQQGSKPHSPPAAYPNAPYQPRNLPFTVLGQAFYGREREMGDLRQMLQESSRVGIQVHPSRAVIHSLGGVGKTRLACEYAHAHADHYTALLFVNASSPESLRTSIAGLSGVLGINCPDDDASRYGAALAWLRQNPGFLLIVDNVDDPAAAAAAQALLKEIPHGHILLTGRLGTWQKEFRTLPLDVLTPAGAIAFLKDATPQRRSTAQDDALAADLAEKLGGLALLLEQATAYMNAYGLGFAQYLQKWETEQAKLLEWWDDDLAQHPGGEHPDHDNQRPYGKNVMVTWLMTVEKLSPSARCLLHLCAYLAPEPIPEAIFDSVATKKLYSTLAEQIPDNPPDLDREALRELVKFNMATRRTIVDFGGSSQPGFLFHRIVQDVSWQKFCPKQLLPGILQLVGNWFAMLMNGTPFSFSNWPIYDPLAPHALVVARMLMKTAALFPESPSGVSGLHHLAGQIFWKLGSWASSHGRFALDAFCSRSAVVALSDALGPEHPDTLGCRTNLACALYDLGKFSLSEAENRQILTLLEKNSGLQHPNALLCRRNLANALQAQGKFERAASELRILLSLQIKVSGADHLEILLTRNNLANLLDEQGKYAQAEAEHRVVLAALEKVLGSTHPDTLVSRGNLANSLVHQSKFPEAEAQLRKVVEEEEKILGPEHPDTLSSRYNLSLALDAQKKYAEALEEAKRALEGRRKVLGAEHPWTKRAERLVGDLERKVKGK